MQRSRTDIPAIAKGIKQIKGSQMPDAISLYSNQPSESINKSDCRKMVTAGHVLVALLCRQIDILYPEVDSRE